MPRPLISARVTRLEDMPEGSAEANLAEFDGALAQAARALRAHGFLPATAAAGGSDAPTLALSSSAGNLQARSAYCRLPCLWFFISGLPSAALRSLMICCLSCCSGVAKGLIACIHLAKALTTRAALHAATCGRTTQSMVPARVPLSNM